MRKTHRLLISISCLFLICCTTDYPRRAEVLFLGSAEASGQSSKYASWLAIELFKSGINLTYTDKVSDLNNDNLDQYDGLVLFSLPDTVTAPVEQALQRFVADGKGITALGAATTQVADETWYTAAIGGRASNTGTGTLTLQQADTSFQITAGVSDFRITGNRYTHADTAADRTVIMKSIVDGRNEPYAWVRQEGDGRIFYTALGQEDAPWKNLNFLRLVNNGIRWTLGDRVNGLVAQLDIPEVSIYPDTIADFTARHFVPGMQDPLSPEESMKLMQTPAGFELKLFAAEPDITNPMAMSWDEKGRLWIIEAMDYPNNFVEVKGAKNDRIKICEDTDGDGVADKFTVFAEGLNIATSLTFANDGIIVAMAPHFLFLKDTDGDDVADVRDTLMTGWNKWDTHAGPSNLQYGFDNKIWGVTGYSGFDGHIDGERQAFSQGVYHFNPDGSDFEFLASTSNNTWGLGMSEDNNVFISTANNTHSAFYSMPERLLARKLNDDGGNQQQVNAVQKIDGHYEVHAMTPNLRQVDVVGGFTSAAGHQLYTAREYPEKYWNKAAFVTEPTVRLVHHAILEPDGAGFREKDGWNLVASSDEWYGPVHAQVGPDGAVWILDWYNFIIQHNVFVPAQAPSDKVLPFTEQTNGPGNAFESDLRDRKYGRVYRLVHKDAKHTTPYELSKDDADGLLKALESDNKFWRMHAQRLLVERNRDDVASELIEIASDKTVDKIGLNAPAIHALWTLQGLGLIALNDKVFDAVAGALQHPSAGVRKAAAQVLPLDNRSRDALLASGILADSNLNTRLAAFVKLTEYPASAAIAEALWTATADTANENDRWLSQALFAAIVQHHGALSDQAAPTGNFAGRIRESLADERYVLGRKTRLQFSPDVSNKEIRIGSEVSRRDNQPYRGLIVGQGDKTNGYALYAKNNRLYFEVYQHGKTTTVSSRGSVPNHFTVNARIDADATLSLTINGRIAGEAKLEHLFTAPLGLYLRSGEDFDDEYAFTDYGESSEFTGNVNNITVRLTPVGQRAAPHPATNGAAEEESQVPTQRIVLRAVKDIMQYDKKLITVRAGEPITLIFENPDGMQHNVVIAQPGTLEIVGKAADAMLRASDAFEKHYVPDIPEVLHHTPLVNPEGSYTLQFTAPEEKGDYPYICTFPGHWRGMNGIMRVVD